MIIVNVIRILSRSDSLVVRLINLLPMLYCSNGNAFLILRLHLERHVDDFVLLSHFQRLLSLTHVRQLLLVQSFHTSLLQQRLQQLLGIRVLRQLVAGELVALGALEKARQSGLELDVLDLVGLGFLNGGRSSSFGVGGFFSFLFFALLLFFLTSLANLF